MKKVLFMLGVVGVLASSQVRAFDGSDTATEYSLSYELQEGGDFEVSLFITDGTTGFPDKCHGIIDKVDGLTETEILMSTLWDDCFSGTSPDVVISSLLAPTPDSKDGAMDKETPDPKKAKRVARRTAKRARHHRSGNCDKMKGVQYDQRKGITDADCAEEDNSI